MFQNINRKVFLVICCLWFSTTAFAECPEGTWSRNLYTGPGGGMSTGPQQYCSKRPPWPIFIKILEENGYGDKAELIRSHLNR